MIISDCLLNAENPRIIDGRSIGMRIAEKGRNALWDARPPCAVDTVVIHYISALDVLPADPLSEDAILKILCDLAVSAHYLIWRDGRVLRLVPEDQRAWHAGGSIMPAPDRRTGVNDFSVGIELAATPDCGFTASQYETAAELCAGVTRRFQIPFYFVGHQDVAGEDAVRLGLRPDVKADPGPFFDWKRQTDLVRQAGGLVADSFDIGMNLLY